MEVLAQIGKYAHDNRSMCESEGESLVASLPRFLDIAYTYECKELPIAEPISEMPDKPRWGAFCPTGAYIVEQCTRKILPLNQYYCGPSGEQICQNGK